MTTLRNILIAIGIITVIGLLGFIVYKQIEVSNRQYSIETSLIKQKELVDGITRSQSQYATSQDIEKFSRENNINLKAIKDDLDKLRAEVASVNVITVKSNGQNGTNIPSTGTGPNNPNPPPPLVCSDGTICPSSDSFGYMVKQQKLDLSEDFGKLKVPYGSVGFSAWQKDPWSLNIKPREYSVSTIVGLDENQKQIVYNKFSVKVDNKTYEIPIATAETKQVVPSPKFSFWNPRIFLGIDGGINTGTRKSEFTPGVHVGIMSYGMYKNSPDFSIIQLGLGAGMISKKPQVIFTPVSYNIGKHIPLMNNLYIGPSAHLGTNGDISIMFGVKSGL